MSAMLARALEQLLPERAGAAHVAPAGGVLIATDAWQPQVNGVVRTLERLADELRARGTAVSFITPDRFLTVPMPSYPDIRLALATPSAVARSIDRARPAHIHIATEGPIGLMTRRHCLARDLPFTTSYHTRFPEYLRARMPLPESWTYRWLRRFHNRAGATLVATPSLAVDLTRRGFTRIRPWTRGVDTTQFSPTFREDMGFPRPIFLSVGRVAVEKNLPAFLDLDLPGTKVLVGDGPALASLRARYPDAVFLGRRTGRELARLYASADVFVFPSRTDTFGIVLLEALASGLPVAAFPVTGPADVLADGVGGIVSPDLGEAARRALALDRNDACRKAAAYSWSACASMFLEQVHAVSTGRGSCAVSA